VFQRSLDTARVNADVESLVNAMDDLRRSNSRFRRAQLANEFDNLRSQLVSSAWSTFSREKPQKPSLGKPIERFVV
jgi:hypothetical protein